MSNLLKIKDFAFKHDVSEVNISVKKSAFDLGDVFSKGDDGRIYVNEDFFVSRKDFRNKVQLDSQEMYFFLEESYIISDIARKLHSYDEKTSVQNWVMFLGRSLFSTDISSVLSYKVRPLMWKFYRFARWIVAEEARKNKLLECVA